MKHHLQGVVVAEEVLVPARDLLRLLRIVPALHGRVEVVRDLARDAGGRAVQPLVVLLEERVVDSRVVVVAVDVGLGHQPHEVVVSDEVLRVQAQVEALLLNALVLLEVLVTLAVVVVHYVRFDAEDGLYALLARLVVERLGGEEVAVVGDRERVHAQRLRLRDKRGDSALPVEQRIRRVQMEMRETGHVVTSCGRSAPDGQTTPRVASSRSPPRSRTRRREEVRAEGTPPRTYIRFRSRCTSQRASAALR